MPKMSKKWAIVLFSSLALNLFVGGMFVSHWIFHGRDEARTHAFGPQGMGRHMDRDTRTALRRMWSERADEMRPLWETTHQTIQDSVAAFGAEPFDNDSLEIALANALAASVALQEAFHTAIVGTAQELTPEQRRSLSAAASRRLHRLPGSRRR